MMITPTPKPTFSEWMRRVDAVVLRIAGVSVYDLDDFCYRDAYDNGTTPTSAARAAVRYAKGDL